MPWQMPCLGLPSPWFWYSSMKKSLFHNFFLALLFALLLGAGNSFAQEGSALAGVRFPFMVGGALGFGSGTGVGTDRGLGLRQIEPMIGIWYPGIGFLRAGYGFFDYSANADDGIKTEVEHSDFDIELGGHLLSELYVVGNYSRAKELSDVGDVAWNEWGLGFGSLLNIFARTMLFAEVSYRWVLSHYDPFQKKKVSGSRLQLNLGFSAYLI